MLDLPGLALVITAIGGVYYQNWSSRKEGRKAGEERDVKIAEVKEVVQGAKYVADSTHNMVNGSYGDVLRELMAVRREIAELTGLLSDRILADEAEKRSDLHERKEE